MGAPAFLPGWRIVLGTAAFVFFILTAVGSWLVPALTNGARDDVPSVKTAQRPPTLSSAAMIPSPSGMTLVAMQLLFPRRPVRRSKSALSQSSFRHARHLQRLPDSQPDQLPNSSPPHRNFATLGRFTGVRDDHADTRPQSNRRRQTCTATTDRARISIRCSRWSLGLALAKSLAGLQDRQWHGRRRCWDEADTGAVAYSVGRNRCQHLRH